MRSAIAQSKLDKFEAGTPILIEAIATETLLPETISSITCVKQISVAAGSIFPVSLAHRFTSSVHTINRLRTSCSDNLDFSGLISLLFPGDILAISPSNLIRREPLIDISTFNFRVYRSLDLELNLIGSTF